MNETHILSWILFTPVIGAIVLLFIPRERDNLHRVVGNVFGMLGLVVSLPLLWRFFVSTLSFSGIATPPECGSKTQAHPFMRHGTVGAGEGAVKSGERLYAPTLSRPSRPG